jgi:hypothetical protein
MNSYRNCTNCEFDQPQEIDDKEVKLISFVPCDDHYKEWMEKATRFLSIDWKKKDK